MQVQREAQAVRRAMLGQPVSPQAPEVLQDGAAQQRRPLRLGCSPGRGCIARSRAGWRDPGRGIGLSLGRRPWAQSAGVVSFRRARRVRAGVGGWTGRGWPWTGRERFEGLGSGGVPKRRCVGAQGGLRGGLGVWTPEARSRLNGTSTSALTEPFLPFVEAEIAHRYLAPGGGHLEGTSHWEFAVIGSGLVL